MKRSKLLLLTITFLAAVFFTSAAFSYQTYPNLNTDGTTSLSDIIWENIIETKSDGSQRLFLPNDEFTADSTYDFVGVVKIDAINTVTGGTIVQPVNTEFTGVFKYSLSGIALNDATTTDNTDLILTFTLEEDDYMRFYADDTNNFNAGATFNPLNLTEMGTATGASDGTLWMALEGSDGSSFVNNHSILTAPGSDAAKILNYTWFNPTFFSAGGLDLVPQVWPDFAGVAINGGSNTSAIYSETEINPTAGDNFPSFKFKGDDPVYLYATPEPATLMLFGLGLFGLAGLVKRKQA